MWTTAGAICSTTSAMKLNLYRGLVSWWRPTLAGRTRCVSESHPVHGEGDSLTPGSVHAELPHITSLGAAGQPGGSERLGRLLWAAQP